MSKKNQAVAFCWFGMCYMGFWNLQTDALPRRQAGATGAARCGDYGGASQRSKISWYI